MRLRPTGLAVAVALVLASPARAQDTTWDNTGGHFQWTTNTSFIPWSVHPWYWDNSLNYSAVFTSNGAGTIAVTSPINLRAINFQANGYTINGTNTLTFANAGSSTLGLVPGEIRVNPTFSAIINAPIGGTVGLTKTGTGTLVLGGANTYSGGTTVSAGGVQVGTGGSSGNLGTGNVAIAGGATLTYNRNDLDLLIGNTFSGGGTLSFGGTGVSDQSSYLLTGNNNSFTGAIQVGPYGRLVVSNGNQIGGASSVTVNSGSSLYVPGGTYNTTFNIAGDGWAEAAGQLGALRVSENAKVGGTINLTGNARLTAWTGETGTISANITDGADSFAVEKHGPGTLTLSGTNTFEGGLNVNGGTLNLTGTNTYGTGDVRVNTATLTITGGGTVVSIAYNPVSTGTVNVGGDRGRLFVGDAGTLNITGGGTVTSGAGHIGYGTGGTGTVNVGGGTGAAAWNTGESPLSVGSAGTLAITGGGTVSNAVGYIGLGSGGTGTVAVGGGTGAAKWNNSQSLTVGYNNPGTLAITGGGTVSNTDGYIGYGTGGTGTVTVGGGTGAAAWNNTGALYVGSDAGTGTLNITGGGTVSNTTGYIGNIGYASGGTGTVTVGGGTGAAAWNNTGVLFVGYSAGTLTVTGGGTVANTIGYIGNFTGSNGTVAVGGGTGAAAWNNTGALYVGRSGTGTLAITGGGTVANTIGYIGNFTGSNGTVAVGGGTGTAAWNNSEFLYVGYSGTGTLNITGGGTVNSADGWIGYASGGTGTVNVGGGTGAAAWNNTGVLFVGYSAGTLAITGGGTVSNTAGYIGLGSGGTGTVAVGGGTGAAAWTNSGGLVVGYTGPGTLAITGGGTVSNTDGYIGYGTGGTGTVTVGGGTGVAAWNNTGALYVGSDAGTGTLNINTGGTVTAAALNGGNATSGINFNGGTLRITATDTASNTITLLAGGGTIGVPTAGTTFTIDSAISGAGSLTKTGVGTLTLTNAGNNFVGGLTVSQGTLNAATDAVLGATLQPVTVKSLGTLNFTTTTTTGRTYDLNSGSLKAASGTTLTFNNAAVGGGFLTGTFATTGSNTFAGTTTLNSTTITADGTNTFQNVNHGGQLTAPSGSANSLVGFYNLPSGRITVASGAVVAAQDFQSSGQLNVNGTGVVNRTGTEPVVLGGGSTTFLGTQVSRGGTINLNGGTLQVRGGLLVNAGLTTSAGGVINGQTVVDYGGLAKGDGFYADIIAVNGGKISGGFSPGVLNAGTLNLNGGRSTGVTGGTFVFEVTDPGPSAAFPSAPGTAGNATGWDTVSAGRVRFTATPADPFTVSLVTLRPAGDVPGLIPNFDPTRAYSWLLIDNPTGVVVDADGNAAVIDPAAVRIDASGFQNPTDGGTFGLSVSGDQRLVYLTFTPVPEPAHVLLLCAAAAGLVATVRRSRRGTAG